MEEAGETYFWDEFNLVGDDGTGATLVFERTERGPEWRLFTLLEGAISITAAEAGSKRVGDEFPFSGRTLRITCVDESRVCEIEGEAPEGVEQGDVAHYLNAESGNEMIVVSWTRDEVEVYRGLNLPPHAVTSAFGIASVPSGALSHLGDAHDDAGKWRVGTYAAVGLVLAVVLVAVSRSGCSRTGRAPKLEPAQLAIGRSGQLNGTQYRVTGHAVVEVGRVGQRHLRHEYSAIDEAGNAVFLWQDTREGASQWTLAAPFFPSQPLTLNAAGALRLGDLVLLDASGAHVTDLFLSRVGQVEGTGNWPAGTDLYGFTASGIETPVAARWNETAITFYHIAPIPQKNIAKDFH
jgi:hypothetical protein